MAYPILQPKERSWASPGGAAECVMGMTTARHIHAFLSSANTVQTSTKDLTDGLCDSQQLT